MEPVTFDWFDLLMRTFVGYFAPNSAQFLHAEKRPLGEKQLLKISNECGQVKSEFTRLTSIAMVTKRRMLIANRMIFNGIPMEMVDFMYFHWMSVDFCKYLRAQCNKSREFSVKTANSTNCESSKTIEMWQKIKVAGAVKEPQQFTQTKSETVHFWST